MKALVTADWHLSNSLPHSKRSPDDLITDRLRDLELTLDWIFKAALDRGLPLLILGDIFNQRQPDAVTLKTAISMFKAAADAGLQVYILAGNHDAHDTRGLHYVVETLTLAGLEGIHALKSGEAVELDGALLCPVPYQSQPATIDWIRRYRVMKTDLPKILLLHDTIVGAILAGGHPAESGIPKNEIAGFAYVLAGHVHEHQSLAPIEGCYIGSPYHLSFGEVGNVPAIGMITTEGKRVAFHPVKVPPELSQHFHEHKWEGGQMESRGRPGAPYFRTVYEGDDDALSAQRAEVDRAIAASTIEARSVAFIHRGGPSIGRARLGVDIVKDGLPSMEEMVADYVKLTKGDAAPEFVSAGLDILKGAEA